MNDQKKLTTAAGCPVVDNQTTMTAGPRGPVLLQDVWLLEKLAHFDREVIPERRMHAKGSGAYGSFTVSHDITKNTRAKLFSQVGEKTDQVLSAARQRRYRSAILPIAAGPTRPTAPALRKRSE